MTADMPRGAKPAPVVPSHDYTIIPQPERISLSSKIDDLLRGAPFTIVEYEEIQNVIVLLKERRRKAILMGEYDISQKAENLIRYVAGMTLQRKFSAFKVVEIKELNDALARAEAQAQAIREKWEAQIAAFNAGQSAAARRMERDQLRRLEEFNADISTTLPAEFCKLSSDLLNLREQERQLVLCHRYEEARKLQLEAQRRELEEAEVQKVAYLQLLNRRKEKILESQQAAIDCFQQRWSRIEDKLNKQMQAEVSTQEKFIENIKLKIRDAESEHIMS
jgi:hypothetical protein